MRRKEFLDDSSLSTLSPTAITQLQSVDELRDLPNGGDSIRPFMYGERTLARLDERKAVIAHAARLRKMTITEFILECAYRAAMDVITNDPSTIVVGKELRLDD